HMIKGRVMTEKGQWTEGLREYVQGLKLLDTKAGEPLEKIVNEHPAFKLPDSDGAPRPDLASNAFGRGLGAYAEMNFPEAQKWFCQPAKFDADARYFYYLGRAMHQQKAKNKREAAIEAFKKAATLETENKPTSKLVGQALERVQGPLRQLVNEYRRR